MLIEMYSKYIQNELNEYVDITRNLWKNLNMADGRSLDEVEVNNERSQEILIDPQARFYVCPLIF